jgi:uncharacterized protein (TIGR03083 family)
VDTWRMIRAERASLAGALASLPAGDWDRRSLCAGWTVRDVVAHLIATARTTPASFFSGLAASGFRFAAMSNRGIHRTIDGHSDRELVEAYRELVDARSAPPGPTASWLGETVVHGEDIFRALGGYRRHPVEHVLAVADFYSTSNLLIGAKSRIEGVTLQATDADWRQGTGPLVSGPAIALVMAMTGRRVALEDLTGDGLRLLAQRP